MKHGRRVGLNEEGRANNIIDLLEMLSRQTSQLRERINNI